MTETKWLTVKEASLLCAEMGLNRTSKTIRSWARRGHVEATKQTTQNGEMWVLDKDELITKIKAELEFKEQQEQVQTSTNPNLDHEPNTSEPVQTRSDQSEPVRTSANPSEHDEIKALESKIAVLQVDVAWRDKMLEKLSRENEKGSESLMGQARYIGHLETQLLGLGGEPDHKFLSAPVAPLVDDEDVGQIDIVSPQAVKPKEPHPDQSPLYTG